jgi:hypothetical protein
MPTRIRPTAPALRWLTLALSTLLLIAAGFVVAPAAQAASCYQTSCNGKDPNAQGCSAHNADSVQFLSPDARIDLRYSPGCDANWARLVYSGPWNCCVQFTLREEQQRWNGSAWVAYRTKNKTFTYGATQDNVWTLMNPNETNDRHRACVVGEACTSWVS